MSEHTLLNLAPVPELLHRLRGELTDAFLPGLPIRVSRAPGRLDVMGGIADYTGSVVLEMPLDRAAAVALQPRTDRNVQVFSFNLLDEHLPFTLSVPLESLARHSADELRIEFNQPGRRWAAYMVGCLFVLHERRYIDLNDPNHRGLNIALLSTVPQGAGVSSSAAVEVATMMNLADHFAVREQLNPMTLAVLCQEVENRIVGAPGGIVDQITSCAGTEGKLFRLLCQPHELLADLALPEDIRVLGIDSGVRHSDGGQYGNVRTAAFMGHRIILDRMREFGRRANRTLEGDPMNGYLANLNPEDYKKYFRPALPDALTGADFLERYGETVNPVSIVNPDETYTIRSATDHHVLEAMRVRHFVEFAEQVAAMSPDDPARRGVLDKAGHLMYASDFAYHHDAGLGAPECALLVDAVRRREHLGLYGARITGGGLGGTVAILADISDSSDRAIAAIVDEYRLQTGRHGQSFSASSPGAWTTGSATIG